MLGRLFQERTKNEKIEDMVRILKSRNALPETFGRDWYSPSNLYRSDGKVKDDYHFEKSVGQRGNGVQITRHEGPWHSVRPKGRGLKFTQITNGLTVSRIPIEDTDYEWLRLESDRRITGYINAWEAQNDPTFQGQDPLYLTHEKPGLNMKYERLKGFKQAHDDVAEALKEGRIIPLDPSVPYKYRNLDELDSDIKYFEERLRECNRDKFGRTYLYFVIRTKQNGKALNYVKFPTKMHQFHDFDKEWHADPLFDTDVAFNVLDQRLKKLIKDTANDFADIKHDLNGNFDDVHGDTEHLLAATEHEDENVARTIAIKRAKPWVREKSDELFQGSDGAMYTQPTEHARFRRRRHRQANMFRLPLDCYARSSGVSIPPEYFEVDGFGEDLKWKYYDTDAASEANSKLILTDEKLEATRKQLEDEIKEYVQAEFLKDQTFVPASQVINKENNEELRTYVKKDEWPETTFAEYQKSLNSYKRSALVYAHHLKHLLIDMKPYVFKNEKFINIECKPEVRAELLEWYEQCIDTLVPEMLMFARNLHPVRELGAEPGPVLYHPKEAKNFLKSAARARDWVPIPGGGARRRVPLRRRRTRTPNRAQQDQEAVQNDQGLEQALEQQNFEPEVEDEIDVIIRDFNEGREYQLRRLVQILSIPQEMWNAIRVAVDYRDVDRDNNRLIWDLQMWPHTTGNQGNWRLVKMLCQRWQRGLEVPLPDPRTAEFLAVVGNDWPNSIPPARAQPTWGRGLYATLATLDDNDSVKDYLASRSFFYGVGLRMIPGILAVLHKTFLWRVSNPISTIRKNGKVLTTILPRCDWFKKIVFSLVTTNGYIPVISPLAQQWLIPSDFANADVEFFSDQSIYNAAGLTEKGYVIDGEIVYDELNRRLHKHAIRWAQKEGLGIQSILNKYERDFNSTSGLGDTISTFSNKGYLSDLENWLGQKAAMLTAGFAESDLPPDQVLKDTMAANWQQGQVSCYATEIRMYNQMNWLVLCWGIMSVASLFVDRNARVTKEGMRTVDAIDLIKLGLPSLAGAGFSIYARWSSPSSGQLPGYLMNIERSMFLSSFIVVGQTMAALIDSSVDPENDLNVQRYVSDRKSWYAWVFGSTRRNNAFKNKANEFVQQSRRFKRDGNVSTIFAPNHYRRQGNGKRKIWFNTDDAELMFPTSTISSNSRAQNIHYPPGFIFTFDSEVYVVVDDLETMYKRSRNQEYQNVVQNTRDPRDVIKQVYRDYEFEDDDVERWDEWIKLKEMEWDKKTYSIFDVLKQFRVCYNTSSGLEPGQRIRIMSVAGRNTAQSIKNTLITAASMSMMCLGMGYEPTVNEVQVTTGAMIAMASIENNIVAAPAVASSLIYSWFRSSAPPLEEAIPMHFFAAMGAAAGSQLISKLMIPKPYPAPPSIKESLMKQQFGILIPLRLEKLLVDDHTGYANGRLIWFGKLWDPILGRLLYFQGRTGNQNLRRGVVKHSEMSGEVTFLHWRPEQPFEQERALMDQMEDCFDISVSGNDLVMDFRTSVLANPVSRSLVRYKYTPSPINRHLWFVKSNV